MVFFSDVADDLLEVQIDLSRNADRGEEIVEQSVKDAKVDLGDFGIVEISQGSKQKTFFWDLRICSFEGSCDNQH